MTVLSETQSMCQSAYRTVTLSTVRNWTSSLSSFVFSLPDVTDTWSNFLAKPKWCLSSGCSGPTSARFFVHLLTFATAQYQSSGSGCIISSHIGTADAKSASGWSRASLNTARASRQFVAAKSAPHGAVCVPTIAALPSLEKHEQLWNTSLLRRPDKYPRTGRDAETRTSEHRESIETT